MNLRQRGLRRQLQRARDAGIPDAQLAVVVLVLRFEFVDTALFAQIIDEVLREHGLVHVVAEVA